MAKPNCKICGATMTKNGFTSAGTQRWRCSQCGSSFVRRIDSSAKWLKAFVLWLLGKPSQKELAQAARTLRAKTAKFWSLWPVIPACDEIHHVVYMDGIWLARQCVVLIACTDHCVLGCHLARSENAQEWSLLMGRIAAPDVLVCDGGGAIEAARRQMWPQTRVQRCVFHVFCQVKRCTTSRPKTQAGVDLYALARRLLAIGSLDEAALWLADLQRWCNAYESFLKERAEDGRHFKHRRLRKARRSLVSLCQAGVLFTYLDERLVRQGPVAATSNRIENLNGQIRRMLAAHRGMNIEHRIKAVFWFCYMHSEEPLGFAQMLREFPDDEQIKALREELARERGDNTGGPVRWGEVVVWSELHMSGSKATGWF